MPKTVTTLTEVRTKSGSSARGPWTMSIFKAADGREYTTFKGDLASKANSLLNQTVELEYSERQNGQYTNYDLEGVEASNATPVVTENVTNGVPKNTQDEFRRSKEEMRRNEALNASLTLFATIGLDPLSSVEEFELWLGVFYNYLETGVFEVARVSVEA